MENEAVSGEIHFEKLPFVHLHVHSSFSTGDAIQPAEEIGKVVKSRGMDAVALTDHGYMGGIPRFVAGCKEAGVKPIIGMESYLAFGLAEDKNTYNGKNNGHLLLLAQNPTGYKNLCTLTHFSFTKGFYGENRIDIPMLEKHSDGLICTSTCLTSHLAQFFKAGDRNAWNTWIDIFHGIFGDRFFFEVQVNNVDLQRRYNQAIMFEAAKRKIPLVLTADAHMQNQGDWRLHGLVRCIAWNELPHLTKYGIQDYNAWMYDQEFAQVLCASWDIPQEAVTNTAYLADMIDNDWYDKASRADDFTFQGMSEDLVSETLWQRAKTGICQNFGVSSYKEVPLVYRERLEHEFRVIDRAKYGSYFLTVQQYIDFAKEMEIPVGPGRGSSGGSLLAWSLGIISKRLDPIKWGLYFERFLNEGRMKFTLQIPELL